MANFDKNQWHQLYTNQSDVMSLLGTNLYQDGKTGSVFFNTTDTDDPRYRWQIFSINSTTYVIRNQDGGGTALLGTAYAPTEDYDGHTRGQMVKGNISDESVYWTITPWNDGTYYMVNEANGTNWHLGNHNGIIILDSNITKAPDGTAPGEQRWTLHPIENATINDSRFSSVELPTYTVTSAPPNPSPTGSAPATTSSVSPQPGGLSTAAKAGIGAGVGAAALIALVLLGLFFWRRRKQETSPSPYQYEDLTPAYQGPTPYDGVAPKYEMYQDNNVKHGDLTMAHQVPPQEDVATVKYEMYQDNNVNHEMSDTQVTPAELPSTAIEPETRTGGTAAENR
ncbi:hypothetical protein K491DRAFT_680723 [Lophiostoma macrostomum CBS 122681]|uniref:Ricin B lectin domain-containing protein n=1 Tax=Lophiostoma macrostomum CBS 122681 TaxID=1314788 RepID=A0A6A6T268_9PLEO|nr:hypothetical protein K491DRAFT_680723 [Lophiostoma macrostomum CBS 122681]